MIYSSEDKNNDNLNRAMMGHFKRFVNDLDLKELPLLGRRYTWSNEKEAPTLVKLDRAFAPRIGRLFTLIAFFRAKLQRFQITVCWCLASLRRSTVKGDFTLRASGRRWRGFTIQKHSPSLSQWTIVVPLKEFLSN